MIKNSGNRREFETGAVRDIQAGKGRCDLLPLDIVAVLTQSQELREIHNFVITGDTAYLLAALLEFSKNYNDIADMVLEVSIHFEMGAGKYGENNWRKGIPANCYINSAVRHYLKWRRGDKDEPHDRAFAWNLLCCAWTCGNKPDLNNYGKHEEEETKK